MSAKISGSGIVTCISVHASPQIPTIPNDANYILFCLDSDTSNPKEPSLNVDIQTNNGLYADENTSTETATKILGNLLHTISHALMTGASIDLTPAGS